MKTTLLTQVGLYDSTKPDCEGHTDEPCKCDTKHGCFHQCRIPVEPGESTEMHFHDRTHETYIVAFGEGEIQVGEKIYKVKAGAEPESGFVDFVEVPESYFHQIRNTGTSKLVVFSTKNRPHDFEDYRTQ